MTFVSNSESRLDFARSLFTLYPNFRPTQALYLDLEGSGSGLEYPCSFYWPRHAGPNRFEWVTMDPQSGVIDPGLLEEMLEALEIPQSVTHIAVFSGGMEDPDERGRFNSLFEVTGVELFPQATWVNLHYVLRKSGGTRRSIRKNRYVWHTGEKLTRNSLEALEFEFGIKRPPRLRAYSNSYSDGSKGEFHVLELARRVAFGEAEDGEGPLLGEYCRFDVESMFKIARWCEKNRR